MKIFFHRHFDKQFAKLDQKIKRQFVARLKLFGQKPFAGQLNNHALKGKFAGYRSINVTGDWRAIYKQIGEDAVEFSAINTHSHLYS